jgi:hypothetical protein
VFEDCDERCGNHEDDAPEVKEVREGQDFVAFERHVENVTEKVSGSLEERKEVRS